jgi:hypothetical protein
MYPSVLPDAEGALFKHYSEPDAREQSADIRDKGSVVSALGDVAKEEASSATWRKKFLCSLANCICPFRRCNQPGVWKTIRHELQVFCIERKAKKEDPSYGTIASQSVNKV